MFIFSFFSLHCHWEMHQQSHDKALSIPDCFCVFRWALWEVSVGVERSVGMLVLYAICYSEESVRDPLHSSFFLLYCVNLQPHSKQETNVGPSHHMKSHSSFIHPVGNVAQLSCSSHWFTVYKVSTGSQVLTVAFLWSLLGNLMVVAVFNGAVWQRSNREQWPDDYLLSSVIFFIESRQVFFKVLFTVKQKKTYTWFLLRPSPACFKAAAVHKNSIIAGKLHKLVCAIKTRAATALKGPCTLAQVGVWRNRPLVATVGC